MNQPEKALREIEKGLKYNKYIESKPRILIIGTGYSGIAEVPAKTREYLENLGIEVIIEPTKKACEIYNQLSEKQGVIAALHLTC